MKIAIRLLPEQYIIYCALGLSGDWAVDKPVTAEHLEEARLA